ncbi:MAG: 2-isopropylmalate synthase [Planctomycetes bacterium]|nr:2-isopropylmalate synthase [Planctomycetota bacterium]MCB9870237.1 2-isopropylmalate synthase [Planctomycetota bacterium]MCB9888182.1 2-isopropylmalate synthase [Planctomycetota bacterium]
MRRIEDLIYDWNVHRDAFHPTKPVYLNDETLRDGLQSPSVADPSVEAKLELIHLMEALGLHGVDLGLPGAGERPREDILRLAKEIADHRMAIRPNVACRTLVQDIEPVIELSQRAGVAVEVCTFIGSSSIRQFAEDWSIDLLLKHTETALSYCRDNDLPVMYVTEDTTRAHPDTVRRLYTLAIELGAKRLCVCDTVGHATPPGVRAVVGFVSELAKASDPNIQIDWHGHRDRGFGLANCLAAIAAGADRIHATALGIGERAGNAEMDLLLVNLRLLGWIDNDLTRLRDYAQTAAKAVDVPIPDNYPVFGSDAFETATGVHAAAVIKAYRKGDVALADMVYSGVPAAMVGLEQKIGVGPMSGRSNVMWVLERMGIEPTDARIQRVLDGGKASKRLLSEARIRELAEG